MEWLKDVQWATVVPTLVVAFLGGGIMSAVVTFFNARRDRDLKLRAETRRDFMHLLSIALAQPQEGGRAPDRAEQIAAITLIGGMGVDYSWLEDAANRVLHRIGSRGPLTLHFHSGFIDEFTVPNTASQAHSVLASRTGRFYPDEDDGRWKRAALWIRSALVRTGRWVARVARQ